MAGDRHDAMYDDLREIIQQLSTLYAYDTTAVALVDSLQVVESILKRLETRVAHLEFQTVPITTRLAGR